MTDYTRIRTAEGYFEEYGRSMIGEQKMDRVTVKHQLIDAIHNEIFSLVAMRAKKQFKDIPREGDPEALRIARNVIRDATKKWLKIWKMFESYPPTRGLLKADDISIIPEGDSIGFDNGELVAREEMVQGTDAPET